MQNLSINQSALNPVPACSRVAILVVGVVGTVARVARGCQADADLSVGRGGADRLQQNLCLRKHHVDAFVNLVYVIGVCAETIINAEHDNDKVWRVIAARFFDITSKIELRRFVLAEKHKRAASFAVSSVRVGLELGYKSTPCPAAIAFVSNPICR